MLGLQKVVKVLALMLKTSSDTGEYSTAVVTSLSANPALTCLKVYQLSQKNMYQPSAMNNYYDIGTLTHEHVFT